MEYRDCGLLGHWGSRGKIIASACMAVLLPACASLNGYPNDPENVGYSLTSLSGSFGPASEKDYYAAAPASPSRVDIRNQLVTNRIRAYDLEFDRFEHSLYSSANVVALTSDFSVLALSGLGATTGSAATKAALSAASGGIVGANGAVNKDLYYQRTVTALLSQMEASRATVKLRIFASLAEGDAMYPLYKANSDLEDLKRAGALAEAISVISQQAETVKQNKTALISSLAAGKYSGSTSSALIRTWLKGDGNAAKLQAWMATYGPDSNLQQIPYEALVDLDNAEMEADRQAAITALNIPTH